MAKICSSRRTVWLLLMALVAPSHRVESFSTSDLARQMTRRIHAIKDRNQYKHVSIHSTTATFLPLSSKDLAPTASSPSPTKTTRATAVYGLMLINCIVFLLDKVFRYSFVTRQLYLMHRRWKWWQPLTTCFCHRDRFHLSNNLFLLLLFGRSVEDDQGWGGLLLSYLWCGVFSSLISLWLLSRNTISIGASGAVFGLFAVSTFGKLSHWSDLFDWRKLVEVAVLGEFAFRQITSELSTAAGGGTPGINHVAHVSGAAAGRLLILGMRWVVDSFERAENTKLKKNKKRDDDSKGDENKNGLSLGIDSLN